MTRELRRTLIAVLFGIAAFVAAVSIVALTVVLR
jgi:hypothetical protein